MAFKHLVPLLALPMAGCLSFGGGQASLAPSAGVKALGEGLVGQSALASRLPADAKAKALAAEFQALEYTPAGQPVTWSADGYSGQVVPTQPYRVGSQDCRAYSQTINGGKQPIRTLGTACKTPDGLWKPVA
ncbi:hypothetical protein [Jiella sp. M17.18]|uniref:hypothetical protein n=1 Tax=Jiella sp. M17.18 TaxID=3234247 RepID=UPI0034DE8B9A